MDISAYERIMQRLDVIIHQNNKILEGMEFELDENGELVDMAEEEPSDKPSVKTKDPEK